MDLRKLKTLIDLVAESGIAELEITEGEGKVRIVKFSQTLQPVAYHQPEAGVAAAPVAAPAPRCRAAAPAPAAIQGHVVKAPMVGTFYRSPNRAPRLSSTSADGRHVLPLAEPAPRLSSTSARASRKAIPLHH